MFVYQVHLLCISLQIQSTYNTFYILWHNQCMYCFLFLFVCSAFKELNQNKLGQMQYSHDVSTKFIQLWL